MWFKNLCVFRLTESFSLTTEELEEKLETLAFRHCAPHEESSFGWTFPVSTPANSLVYSANGFIMLCAKKEERVLPSAVVHELVQERIEQMQEQLGRRLSKKERTALKDEIIFEALPKAFTFSRKSFAYIDTKGGWFIANSSSLKSAEDVLSLLRQSLGSLPAIPLNTINRPATIMTQWLLNEETIPNDIAIEDECELRQPEENGAIVRCKRHDLTLPEIKNHLDKGKEAIKLAMNWNDRLGFILDETLTIKRLRFLELIQQQAAEIEVHDEVSRFDADFAIMALELNQFLPRLLDLFGGEAKA
ncbi:MAG: recombination-associated protein RdgC [Methylococcaceae bacterium]